MAERKDLMLEQIQSVTGHRQSGSLRVLLTRRGVVSSGVFPDQTLWPPKKVYAADEVWHALSHRILQHVAAHPEAADACWEMFEEQIRNARSVRAVRVAFADRLDA